MIQVSLPDPATLSPTEIDRLLDAADDLLSAIAALHNDGQQLVGSVLDGAVLTAWDHYPPDDIHDADSGGHYFYHAHDPGERGAENGHFHLFVEGERVGAEAGLGPLAALSVAPNGLPDAIFTTSLSVTGGVWLSYDQALAAWDRFSVAGDNPHPDTNALLTALVRLLRPAAPCLLAARDRSLAAGNGDEEVLSSLSFDLAAWIEALQDA